MRQPPGLDIYSRARFVDSSDVLITMRLIIIAVHIPVLKYIYSIYDSVDCVWNDWTVGACSATCGDGMRTDTRTEKISAAYGGEECKGPASIQEVCNIQDCPGIEEKYLFLYMVLIFYTSEAHIY